ncbi:pilus assembly protein [bacterium]|nr:pilus assembly protein [bacterium]
MFRFSFKKGAALVEFAIVTTVMIPVFMYSQYFSEVMHIQHVADEAGYFASWEITGYQLSDYKPGVSLNNRKNSVFTPYMTAAKKSIKERVLDLYKNFDSADKNLGGARTIMITPQLGELKLTTQDAKIIDSQSKPDSEGELGNSNSGDDGFVGRILDKLNDVVSFIMEGWFGFNVSNAGLQAEFSINYKVNDAFKNSQKYLSKENQGGFFNQDLVSEEMITGHDYTTLPLTIISDTWFLNEGAKVDVREKAVNRAYVSQVEKMMWFGVIDNLFNAIGLEDLQGKINQYLSGTIFDLPITGHVISENITGISSAPTKNYDETDGNRDDYDLDERTEQQEYYGTPLYYTGYKAGNSNSVTEEDRQYHKTLEKRKDFYLGNGKKQCNYFDGCD